MSSSSDSANLNTVISENNNECEESNNFHTETFTSEMMSEFSQTNKSFEILSTSKQFDDTEDQVAIKMEVDLETGTCTGFSPDTVTSLFPFICGICDFKVNRISAYLTHFQKHENFSKYLHCCFEMDKTTEYDNSDLYYCGACGVKFPSLCTLYSHLVSDEGTPDFVFHGDQKVAHLSCTQSEIQGNNASENISDKVNCDTVTNSKADTSVEINKEKREEISGANDIEKVITAKAKLPLPPKRNSKGKRKLNRKVDKNQEIKMKKNSVVREERKGKKRDKKIENNCSKIGTRCQSRKEVKKKGRLTGSEFPCETCGKMMKYGSLKEHSATHEKHLFPCDLCNLKFKSRSRVQIHKAQVHVTDKKFTCDECGKSFKALAYLRQHSQTHLKERNVQCPVCAKMFLYKNVLRIHLLTHSEKRTHHCNICGKGFKRHSDVLVHKEGVHEAVEKYPCTICDKKFATKDRLRKHRLIHQPPKFSCQFCGKSFVRSENLRTHMKVHGDNT